MLLGNVKINWVFRDHSCTRICSTFVRKKQVLETYESFRETLAKESNDKPHRPELRRALAALLEKIVLDPHGRHGVWRFTVQLKGACEAVEIVRKAKPEGWLHRGLQPRDRAA
jgi:hypothetical protein